jgi:enediyne polyketide synthase
VVERALPRGTWPAPLLGPSLERRTKALLPGSSLSVQVERNGHDERRARSDRALKRASGSSLPIMRRPDGKPELAGDRRMRVSSTHAGNITLAVAGPDTVACDLEPAVARSTSLWRDLLGPDRWELARFIMRETGEDETLAATRTWVASECLTKAAIARSAPLVWRGANGSRDVLLASGSLAVATFILPEGNNQDALVVGLLVRHRDASL